MKYPRFYEKNLPHWQPEGVTFAVQFRLEGSLPRKVIEELRQARDQQLAELAAEEARLKKNHPDGIPHAFFVHLEHEKHKAANPYAGKFNHLLEDPRSGPKWLAQPEIANIVRESMHYMETTRGAYKLWAYCIMSNHVHMVLSDVTPVLHKVMQSIKRHTARQANIHLGRTGQTFWLEESYDHIIRDAAEFSRQMRYVLNNPVAAGLVKDWRDWPYTYRSPDL